MKKLAKCLVLLGILLVVFPASFSAIEETEIIWGQPKPIKEIIDFADNKNCAHTQAARMAVKGDELEMIIDLNRCNEGEGDHDLWMFERDSRDEPWEGGTNLNDISTNGDINTDSKEYSPTVSLDGTILIWERKRPKGGGTEFWQSERVTDKDSWGPAQELSDVINLPGADNVDPSISPDKKELYFSSNRPGSKEGINTHGKPERSRDIWVTNWDSATDTWGTPENLDGYRGGPEINSAAWDEEPTISSNGLHLLFISDRISPYDLDNEDRGDFDIYWYSRKTIYDPWGSPFGFDSWRHPSAPINTDENEHAIHIVNDTLYVTIGNEPHFIRPFASAKTTIISIGRYKNAERTVTVRGGLGLIAERTFVPMHWSDQKGVPEQYLYLINSED